MHLNSVDDLVACAEVALERARKTLELAVMGVTPREGPGGERHFQLYSPHANVAGADCGPLRTIIEDLWTVIVAEDDFIAKSVPDHLDSIDPERLARLSRLRESPPFSASYTNLKSFYDAVRCGLPIGEGALRVPEVWSPAFEQGAGYLAKIRDQLVIEPDETRPGDVLRGSQAAAAELFDLFEQESEQRKIYDVMDEAVASRLEAACADMEIVLDRLKAAVEPVDSWSVHFLVRAASANLSVVLHPMNPRAVGGTDVKFFIKAVDHIALEQATEYIEAAAEAFECESGDELLHKVLSECQLSAATKNCLAAFDGAMRKIDLSELPGVRAGLAFQVSHEEGADALEATHEEVVTVWRGLMCARAGDDDESRRLVLRNLFDILDPIRIESFATHPNSRFRFTIYKPGKVILNEVRAAWERVEKGARRMEEISAALATSAHRDLPLDEREVVVRDYLKDHPKATIREVVAKTGLKKHAVENTPAWKAHAERKRRRTSGRNVVNFSEKLLETARTDNPQERLAQQEELERLLAESRADYNQSGLDDDSSPRFHKQV